MSVEAFDLGRDNTGPLVKSCNLDKGLLVAANVEHAGY